MSKKSVTKQYLMQALVVHLSTRKVTKLTVTDFLRHTELSRTTFYQHFPDGLFNLFNYTIAQTLMNDVADYFQAGECQKAFEVMTKEMSRNRLLFCNLYFLTPYETRRYYFEKTINEMFDYIKQRYHQTNLSDNDWHMMSHFYTWSVVRQFETWFDNQLQEDPQLVNQCLKFAILQGQKYLQENKLYKF